MKLVVSKSKNAASFYVVKSIYENGVRTSKIVEKLGTELELREKLMGRDPYDWAKEYVAQLTKEEQKAKRKVILEYSPLKMIKQNQQVTFHGGYLFIQKLYYELGLHKICATIKKKYRFTFDLNDILSSLIYSRILFPASKRATYELSKTFIEQSKYDIQHVYRALEILTKEADFIQAELYKNSLKISKRNTGVLYYDCTNFFFEIEQANSLKQYGKSKENRPNPLVSMGLFMDGNGVPLAFHIHPGNTNEQVTLRPLEKKILSDFELSRFVVCTDAGLASNANRRFNDKSGRAFITTQSIKKLKKDLKDEALDPAGWKITAQDSKKLYNLDEVKTLYQSEELPAETKKDLESKIFYKERWINENNLEQRLLVTYSLKYSNYQASIRNGQVERAQKLIDTNSTKLKKCNANDCKRFIKKEHCTPDGEVAATTLHSIDLDLIHVEAKYDGFYAVCTNLDDEISSIVDVNKRRWEIEECFRIMKSEFEARPVYLQRDDRIEAHFMTCFISLIIYRLLEQRLENKYTCSKILSTLREMDFYKVQGEGYIPTYKRTDLTDALHDTFGFRTDYEILNTQQIKKVIKFTKQ